MNTEQLPWGPARRLGFKADGIPRPTPVVEPYSLRQIQRENRPPESQATSKRASHSHKIGTTPAVCGSRDVSGEAKTEALALPKRKSQRLATRRAQTSHIVGGPGRFRHAIVGLRQYPCGCTIQELGDVVTRLPNRSQSRDLRWSARGIARLAVA